jgi:hypothetical protein
MRKLFVVGAIALAISGRVLAHEGHAHKVMGTVAAISAEQIEVDTKDGKKETYALAKDAKYLKGKAVATQADVKPGMRVVLSVVEKDKKKSVTEVMMAAEASQHDASGHKH